MAEEEQHDAERERLLEVQAALLRREEELETLNETLEQKVVERTQSLRERSEQVQALASELTLAEQVERRRIAQILHNDLQQRLYGGKMQLLLAREALEEGNLEAVDAELEQIEQTLSESIGLTRNLSIDLSPPVLTGEGLVEAIGWLATQLREQHEMTIETETETDIFIAHEDLRVLLFQLVRELLLNVVRHARVSRATVTLAQEHGEVRVQVVDDGSGFDVGRVLGGYSSGEGLRRIGHRLTLFGGSMEIKSAPGRGARVTIVVPLKRPVVE